MSAPERMKMAPPRGFFGWCEVLRPEDDGVEYVRADVADEWKRQRDKAACALKITLQGGHSAACMTRRDGALDLDPAVECDCGYDALVRAFLAASEIDPPPA